MQRLHAPPRLSSLEILLLGGGVDVIYKVLSFWEPLSIFSFARANSKAYKIVLRYWTEQWNISSFLSRYFSDRDGILDILKSEDAYIFGPTVFCFFDRRPLPPTAIDLCIRVDSVPYLSKFLDQVGFKFVKKRDGLGNLEVAVKSELVKTIDRKLRSSGDRNASQNDRSSWVFEFSRMNDNSIRDCRQLVRLHVVRCEPYQHILSLHSSGLMNFINSKCAISLFPRSTFIHRRSFVSRQEYVQSDQSPFSHKTWLEQYGKSEGIQMIDVTNKIYKNVELGPRFIGDRHCWTVALQPTGQLLHRLGGHFEGASFEVLDWRSGTTNHESYLRIGEPGIWSTWSQARKINMLGIGTILQP